MRKLTADEQVQFRQDWIRDIFNGLDLNAIHALAWERLENGVNSLEFDELLAEIETIYPEFLDDWDN